MWIFLFVVFALFSYFWWVFIALAMFEVIPNITLFDYKLFELTTIFLFVPTFNFKILNLLSFCVALICDRINWAEKDILVYCVFII